MTIYTRMAVVPMTFIALSCGSVARSSDALQRSVTGFHQNNSCGVICLLAMCKYFGIEATWDEVAATTEIDADGTSVRSIVQSAERHGLNATVWSADVSFLRLRSGPAIVNYPSNHFCIFLGWKNAQIMLYDPPFGVRGVDTKDFAQKWSGVVVEFRPSRKLENLAR